MKKKVALLLLVLTDIIPIACCPENPAGPYLLNLNYVSLLKENYITRYQSPHEDYFLPPKDIYTEDTLILSLKFNYTLAQNIAPFSLQPAAFALSCDDSPDLTQLNDKIRDIIVTSNYRFNDVEAGQSLNSKLVAFNNDYKSPVSLVQAASLINALSGNEFFTSSKLETLAIIERPIGSHERIFRVTVNYESGKQEVAETTQITW